MKHLNYLIVAAYNNELAPLCKMGSRHLVLNKGTAFLSAGIGPVVASFGLTNFLNRYQPDFIISIGTAGTFDPKKHKIGEIVFGKVTSIKSGINNALAPRPFHTIKYANIQSSILKQTNQKICDKDLVQNSKTKLKSISHVSVYCPQEITTSKNLSKKLSENGFEVENLEAHAFAFVAKNFNLPIISILGITNIVGPNGHKEWLLNEKTLCKKMAGAVQKMICI